MCLCGKIERGGVYKTEGLANHWSSTTCLNQVPQCTGLLLCTGTCWGTQRKVTQMTHSFPKQRSDMYLSRASYPIPVLAGLSSDIVSAERPSLLPYLQSAPSYSSSCRLAYFLHRITVFSCFQFLLAAPSP